nr:hypothetical protein [Tanacetum cinerariifolium]
SGMSIPHLAMETRLELVFAMDFVGTALAMTDHVPACMLSSTNTCLLRSAKLVDAILLSASAFLFSLMGTFLIENALKLLVSVLTFSSPAPKPSMKDDPSVNKIHGSGSSSSTSIRVSRESSFGRSTMKSANIRPLTDTLGL